MSAPKDDLYMEVTYIPTAYSPAERWRARVAGNKGFIKNVYGEWEWLVIWKGKRVMAKERKRRILAQRAQDYGKKVIR